MTHLQNVDLQRAIKDNSY